MIERDYENPYCWLVRLPNQTEFVEWDDPTGKWEGKVIPLYFRPNGAELESVKAKLKIAEEALEAIKASPFAPAIANDPTGIAANALRKIRSSSQGILDSSKEEK